MADRRAVAAGLLAVLLLAGCTAADDEPTPGVSPSAGESPAPTPTGTGSTTDGATGGTEGEDASDAPDAPAEPAPDGVLPTAEPVPLEATADFGTGVTSALESVEAIQAEARGPGEVSGPALSFRVRITNDTADEISLDAVTVNLADDEGAPGIPMFGPPAQPFSGALAAGRSAVATYVFAIDEGSREVVSLEVSYSTQAPVVVFSGAASDV